MSLKDNDWWSPFISRLQNESLANLCLEFGLIEEAVIPELIEESRELPVTDALWWAEVCRQVDAGENIRTVARRFGTHTRRIRKAMARSGSRNSISDSRTGKSSSPAPVESAPEAPRVDSRKAVAKKKKAIAKKVARTPRAEPRLPLSTSLPKRAGEEPSEGDTRRRRRGRLRLVRPELTDEPVPEAESPRRAPRKPKVSPHSEVRVIDVDEVDLSDLIVKPAPTYLQEVPPVSAPLAVVSTASVSAESVPSVKAAPVKAAPVTAAPVTAAPVSTAPVSTAPVSAPATRPLTPVPTPAPRLVRSLTNTAWRVRIDGAEQPMVVVASDILQAAELFADQLGADALRRADIYSAPLL